jgi:hypothetical protein
LVLGALFFVRSSYERTRMPRSKHEVQSTKLSRNNGTL